MDLTLIQALRRCARGPDDRGAAALHAFVAALARRTDDPDLADLAQDLVIKVTQRAETLLENLTTRVGPEASAEDLERRFEKQLKAYLAVALKNAATDRGRRRTREARLADEPRPLVVAAPEPELAPSGDQAAVVLELFDELVEAADRRPRVIPGSTRRVADQLLDLRFHDGDTALRGRPALTFAELIDAESGGAAPDDPAYRQAEERLYKRHRDVRKRLLETAERLHEDGVWATHELALIRQLLQQLLRRKPKGA